MASLVYLALKGDAKALVSQEVEYEDLQSEKALDKRSRGESWGGSWGDLGDNLEG